MGRNPNVAVCLAYVFAPYVARAVIGDPTEGLARIADLGKWSGLAAPASVRVGFSSVGILLVIGILLMLRVAPHAEAPDQ